MVWTLLGRFPHSFMLSPTVNNDSHCGLLKSPKPLEWVLKSINRKLGTQTDRQTHMDNVYCNILSAEHYRQEPWICRNVPLIVQIYATLILIKQKSRKPIQQSPEYIAKHEEKTIIYNSSKKKLIRMKILWKLQ